MTDAISTAAQTNTDAASSGNQADAGSTLMTNASPSGNAAANGAAPANAADSTNANANASGANADNKQTDKKDVDPAAIPDKYDLKTPEGVALDEAALAEFEPIAKELKLTNEQAQKLADLHTKRMQETDKANAEQWKQTTAKWVDDVKADKELGGANLDTSVRHAQTALNKFGTPELLAQMDATGMGNHPELVRVFARIGKAMAEDNFIQSGKDGVIGDPAKRLFPSMN
jgi:hypothetical protein